MTTFWTKDQYARFTVDIGDGTVLATFVPGEKVVVKRIILVGTVAHTGAAAAVAVERETAGGANAEDFGDITVPLFSAGDVLVWDVSQLDNVSADITNEGGTIGEAKTYGPDSKGIVLEPNQQLVLTSDSGGDGGDGVLVIQYQSVGFYGGYEDAIEMAFTPT